MPAYLAEPLRNKELMERFSATGSALADLAITHPYLPREEGAEGRRFTGNCRQEGSFVRSISRPRNRVAEGQSVATAPTSVDRWLSKNLLFCADGLYPRVEPGLITAGRVLVQDALLHPLIDGRSRRAQCRI